MEEIAAGDTARAEKVWKQINPRINHIIGINDGQIEQPSPTHE